MRSVFGAVYLQPRKEDFQPPIVFLIAYQDRPTLADPLGPEHYRKADDTDQCRILLVAEKTMIKDLKEKISNTCRAGLKRSSNSIDTILEGFKDNNDLVSEPGPGPISKTDQGETGEQTSATFSTD